MKYHHTPLLLLLLLTMFMAGCVNGRRTADGATVGEAFGRFIAEGGNTQGPLFGHGTESSE